MTVTWPIVVLTAVAVYIGCSLLLRRGRRLQPLTKKEFGMYFAARSISPIVIQSVLESLGEEVPQTKKGLSPVADLYHDLRLAGEDVANIVENALIRQGLKIPPKSVQFDRPPVYTIEGLVLYVDWASRWAQPDADDLTKVSPAS